jgi:hypothetical protein
MKQENKVVEYEVITTKKYRQVVKVQFDKKYSNELNETKITPSDIDFELGEEIKGEETQTFSTKIVNETPDCSSKFMTYLHLGDRPKPRLGWGNFVPNKTKSVLVFKSNSCRGTNNMNKVIHLTCSMDLVEQLWKSSNLKELSSHIVSFQYLLSRRDQKEEEIKEWENGLDFLKRIHIKRKSKPTEIWIYEVQDYIEFGKFVIYDPWLFSKGDEGRKELT